MASDTSRTTPTTRATRALGAWGLSVAVHVAALGTGAALAIGMTRPEPAKRAIAARIIPPTTELELPEVTLAGSADAQGLAAAPTHDDELERAAGALDPALDTGRAGRGGDRHAPDPALNLADRDDGILRTDEVLSHLDKTQLQRIRSGETRQSRDDWRASREPMQLTFLAMGKGRRLESRALSATDPSRGASRDRASAVGGHAGAEPLPEGANATRREAGSADEGGERASSGPGVRDGAKGSDRRASADAAKGRPMVEQNTPSVPSDKDGKPSDNRQSDQEVALMQGLLHASGPGGAKGAGKGGSGGGGAPASGGSAGPGSRSSAIGQGGSGAPDPNDARKTDYVRKMLAKIWPHTDNAVPKWAIVEGLQPMVVVSFVVLKDGSVTAPSVTRPSGVPDFDEKIRAAVVKAAPFAPLPAELGPQLRYSMPFKINNPAVRPKSSGATKL